MAGQALRKSAIRVKGHSGSQRQSMPALKNPRHEAFAQALFAGLVQPNLYSTHGAAYAAVGYTSNGVGKAGGTAEANASRLLKKAKIFDRVQELQQEHYKRVNKKVDLSKERVGRRLDLASTIAEQDRKVQGIVASALGIAKVFPSLRHSKRQPTRLQISKIHARHRQKTDAERWRSRAR